MTFNKQNSKTHATTFQSMGESQSSEQTPSRQMRSSRNAGSSRQKIKRSSENHLSSKQTPYSTPMSTHQKGKKSSGVNGKKGEEEKRRGRKGIRESDTATPKLPVLPKGRSSRENSR